MASNRRFPMNRLPFVLTSISLALLAAGCATESSITPAPAPVVVAPQAPAPYVVAPAGTVVVPQASAAGTVVVAPGGTTSGFRRIVMRMDDGSVQYFDTQAGDLAVGERIEITTDGTMRHP